MAGADTVASCSMDRTVKLWDVNTLGLKITLLGHSKVRSCAGAALVLFR